MNYFIQSNKKLLIYSLICLLIIPFVGVNFLLSLMGNILLLVILIPLLLLLITFVSLNSFKSKLSTCEKCGVISFGISSRCVNCGANLENINIGESIIMNDPSESTIEIEAEEIK